MRPYHNFSADASHQVYFYVPSTFNAHDYPELDGLENEANWMVHRIITLHSSYNDCEFVCISKKHLEKYIHPSQLGIVKRTLIGKGIIECDNKYFAGDIDRFGREKCLGYKIADGYTIGGLKPVRCTKQSLAMKIVKHRITYEGKPIDPQYLDGLYTSLLAWVGKARLSPELAADLINSIPTSTPPDPSMEARKQGMRMCTNILNSGNPDFSICNFGRIHSPITRLSKTLRPFVTIDDQPLVNIDIRNSQLIFLVLLIIESGVFSSTTCSTYGVRGLLPSPLPPSASPLSSLSPSSINKLHFNNIPRDVKTFIDLVLGGQIYDHLMMNIGMTDRGKFKPLCFRDILYGDDDSPYVQKSVLRKIFKDQFPNVDKFVRDAKRANYCDLAKNMQRSESNFLIKGVCDHIRRDEPSIPILTIHDSIMTLPAYVDFVRDVILDDFKKMGICPKLKVDGNSLKNYFAENN